MPLVSVILPAHNEAEVIDRAIKSVRTQTLEDSFINVVVVHNRIVPINTEISHHQLPYLLQ